MLVCQVLCSLIKLRIMVMQLVHKRHYLLRDAQLNKRQVIEHTPLFRRHKILREFDEAELRQITLALRPVVLQKIEASKVMSDFWNQASAAIQDDLVISFYYHEHMGLKKVLNVQTEDWLEVDFFKKLHQELRRKRWHFLHPRSALRAMRATLGKHVCNLRFENIHLAIDAVEANHFYQVHWDISHPSSLSKMLRHFIFDDILG